MSGQDVAEDGSTDETGAGSVSRRSVTIVFEFAGATELVTGQRITGFPSDVVEEKPIVIDPLPQGLDKATLQAAINRRAADLATVAQALGLASSLLADTISALDETS